MHATLMAWREWADNQQNYIYAANQALHNFFLVWFAAAPWFAWFMQRERRRQPSGSAAYLDRLAGITFWVLLLLMASGFNFGAIDLAINGKLRDIGPVPIGALAVKIGLAAASLVILFYLRWILASRLAALPPDAEQERRRLERRRDRLWLVLVALGPLILTAAAVLRFTS